MTPSDPMTADAPGPAPGRVTELAVSGMDCGNCARHVTEALQAVEGVDSVLVRLEEARATVRWKANALPAVEGLVAAVREAGYQAIERGEGQAGADSVADSPLAVWRFNVILGGVLTVPLVVGEWVLRWGHEDWFKWLGLALAGPVMLVCGRGFFAGAWRQLKRGASNMDTLVALGSSTAFGFSVWGLLTGRHGHLYFMEAAAILTLISAGHWLEALAGARAAGALRQLLSLAPAQAVRVGADGTESEVPVSRLVREEVVILRPGDRVPVDGEVTEGASAVDEALLTGESMPVEKSRGARLFAGTLNLNGRLRMRVLATGEATALAQIIAVVQRAQSSRAGIQRLADRISSVFVPVVVLIALGTALGWGLGYESVRTFAVRLLPFLPAPEITSPLAAAFIHAAAVLIVACPCAMGLATPAAIMAGANVAARRGILIRDAQALEKSGRITAVAFDKTGTLTQGRAAVVAAADLSTPDDGWPPLASMAVGLARSSFHPLSRAVAEWGRDEAAAGEPLEPYAWQEVRGRGIQASWSGDTLRLGAPAWLRECGVDVSPVEPFVAEWSARGATLLALAVEQRVAGVFALRDELKPQAAAVVRQLHARGLKVFVITGDHRGTAEAMAALAGVPAGRVLAEVRPERKAEVLEELQRRGERVAFVGDGINDAPALEQADLGVAVSRASDVAREAADLILLHSDIQAIPEAIGLAQATLRTIRQNLFWAFFYNAAAIPLAALGFLSPVICALAMGLSDLVVIGNALRLNRWRP